MAKNDDFTSRKIVNFTTGKLFEWLAGWLAWLAGLAWLGWLGFITIRIYTFRITSVARAWRAVKLVLEFNNTALYKKDKTKA